MAKKTYMVAESTLLTDARNFSMQAAKDIQNGAIVGKGDLVSGEREIYTAEDDYADGMYLVLNPAWSYESGTAKQNEENYVNKAGVAFRAYGLKKDMKFKISNIATEFEVGDEVRYDHTTGTYVAGSSTGLKVVAVEEGGFPFCIGSIGIQVVGDDDNDYGYATGARTKKYTIEVVK